MGTKDYIVRNYCALYPGHYKVEINQLRLKHQMLLIHNLTYNTVENFMQKLLNRKPLTQLYIIKIRAVCKNTWDTLTNTFFMVLHVGQMRVLNSHVDQKILLVPKQVHIS